MQLGVEVYIPMYIHIDRSFATLLVKFVYGKRISYTVEERDKEREREGIREAGQIRYELITPVLKAYRIAAVSNARC